MPQFGTVAIAETPKELNTSTGLTKAQVAERESYEACVRDAKTAKQNGKLVLTPEELAGNRTKVMRSIKTKVRKASSRIGMPIKRSWDRDGVVYFDFPNEAAQNGQTAAPTPATAQAGSGPSQAPTRSPEPATAR